MLTKEEEQIFETWKTECAKKGFPRHKDGICLSIKQFLVENPRPNSFTDNVLEREAESSNPQNSGTITFEKFKEIVGSDYLKMFEKIRRVAENCNEDFFRLYKLWQEFTKGNVEDEDIQSNKALVDDPEENAVRSNCHSTN
ncbi:hypothetical protein ILUMI_17463 [Ignelater luminosus]|uniref:Uncharacterized protein n=1 Tax=Ignelater luminosus TaxID=2038154 RepID=A0A8K0CK24_IGNLU|nr:hypothetical protein ILUMI_17463 [Ignelater luminosus]